MPRYATLRMSREKARIHTGSGPSHFCSAVRKSPLFFIFSHIFCKSVSETGQENIPLPPSSTSFCKSASRVPGAPFMRSFIAHGWDSTPASLELRNRARLQSCRNRTKNVSGLQPLPSLLETKIPLRAGTTFPAQNKKLSFFFFPHTFCKSVPNSQSTLLRNEVRIEWLQCYSQSKRTSPAANLCLDPRF